MCEENKSPPVLFTCRYETRDKNSDRRDREESDCMKSKGYGYR